MNESSEPSVPDRKTKRPKVRCIGCGAPVEEPADDAGEPVCEHCETS